MDVERALVTKTAHSGAIMKMVREGVRTKHFADSTHRAIWDFMADFDKEHRQAPTISVLQEHFPDYLFDLPDEPLTYIRDRFIGSVKRREAIKALEGLADDVDDPSKVQEIDEIFLDRARRLTQIFPTTNIHHFKDMDKRVEDYMNLGQPVGIPMGIKSFDHITNGIYDTEYVTIMGFQGRGKSTLAQWILHNAYWDDRTCMYISLEMGAQALLRKWDTMSTQVVYNRYKRGELLPEELAKLQGKAAEVRERKNDIIVKDVVVDCTVDLVFAEIERHRPDICCIDYVSLMKTPRDAGNSNWERIMYITNNLKQIARTTHTPIIGVAQTNRSSAREMPEADQVGFSLSIVQDSDIVIGLHRDDEMKKNNRMAVRMLKNRDGEDASQDLYWDMSRMDFRDWNEKDAFTARVQQEVPA